MPNYRFECDQCKHEYYELCFRFDDTGKYPDVACPRCQGVKKTQLVTTPGAVIFSNPRGTSKADSFTYVAGYNMEQAKGERRKAEEFSKSGDNPYPQIDDVSGGEHFGEVK